MYPLLLLATNVLSLVAFIEGQFSHRINSITYTRWISTTQHSQRIGRLTGLRNSSTTSLLKIKSILMHKIAFVATSKGRLIDCIDRTETYRPKDEYSRHCYNHDVSYSCFLGTAPFTWRYVDCPISCFNISQSSRR